MRTTPRARGAVTGLCLLVAGITMAPASAHAWERPMALSPSTPGVYVDGPRLAVNASGDPLLTWTRGRASGNERELHPSMWVEASSWLPEAGRGAPAQRLSAPGELALDAWPALQPSGRAVVWWTTVRRGIADITTSEAVRAQGAWSVAPLDAVSGVWVERVAATAPDGTLAVGEVDPRDERPRFRLRVRTADGSWREAPPIRAPGDSYRAILVEPDGTVLVAWLEPDAGDAASDVRTRLSTRAWNPRSGTWTARQTGAAMTGAAGALRLVVTPDGAVVAIVGLDRGSGRAVLALSRPPGGVFGPPRVLATGDLSLGAEAAVSAAGDVFVAFGAADGPRLRIRRADGAWSRSESAPRGECVGVQNVSALAAGPSGEALLVTVAGGEAGPGPARAWLRRPDGSWAGPVWLSRAGALRPVAGIDGAGRLHVAWSREWVRYPFVEVTTSAPRDVAAVAVPQDVVTVVSRVRVVARGRSRVVRFRLSRPGRVTVVVRSATPRRDFREFRTTIAGRRGVNAVPLRVRGPERVPRGRWTATVRDNGPVVTGCPVTSAAFRVR